MTAISLVTTGARLAWGVGDFNSKDRPWTLGLTCRLDGYHRLKLATGEDIADVALTVGFVFDDEARTHAQKQLNEKQGAVDSDEGLPAVERSEIYGVGAYFAARDDLLRSRAASIHFTLYLPEHQHTRVIDHARHGQWPQNLTFELFGPIDGWGADTTSGDWDNVKWPRVGITSVAFDVPLAVEPDRLQPAATSDQSSAATPVGADLLPTLARLAKWQIYIFWALVTLVIVTLSHR